MGQAQCCNAVHNAEQQQPQASDQQESQPAVERNVRIGPAAQHLLRSSGLQAEDIRPTGPRGILTKSDVLQAIESGAKPSKVGCHPTSMSQPMPVCAMGWPYERLCIVKPCARQCPRRCPAVLCFWCMMHSLSVRSDARATTFCRALQLLAAVVLHGTELNPCLIG